MRALTLRSRIILGFASAMFAMGAANTHHVIEHNGDALIAAAALTLLVLCPTKEHSHDSSTATLDTMADDCGDRPPA